MLPVPSVVDRRTPDVLEKRHVVSCVWPAVVSAVVQPDLENELRVACSSSLGLT